MLQATLYLGCCCTPSLQLPWAIPDLDAVVLQNSIACPSPSCQSPAEELLRSYLFAEYLLALGIVDPRCPAPVSEALPVAII